MAAPPRTERPPRKILLATDLSARCDRALDRAASLASGWQAELIALHVLEQPEEFYAGELERRLPSWRRPTERARIVEEQLRHDLVQAFPGEDLATWLTAAGVPATGGGGVALLVEYGDPSHLLRQYAHDRKVDLVVLATHGRSALLNVLVGSTAREIVSSVPCDTLIVREPRATGPGAASERARGTSG